MRHRRYRSHVRHLLLPFWLVWELIAILLTLILAYVVTPFVHWLVTSPKGTRPVLLVHGFGMARASQLLLGWRLARAGFAPLRFAGYWSHRRLDDATAKIAHAAALLAEHAGTEKVDVVAHSMGGIVARAARTLPEGKAIGRVVTLGTPHRGVFWRHFPLVLGPLTRAMRPGTVGDASEGDLAITSSFDLVIPWSAATLDPPGVTKILHGVGHAGLLLDSRAAKHVVAHLAS
jgi:pimeloyl-ACP methyl ester carboxylesterase